MSVFPARSLTAAFLQARVPRALAGADLGVRAGIVILGWYAAACRMRGEFWWTYFNLAGAAGYGERVYQMGLSKASALGAALILCLYVAPAVLYATLVPSSVCGIRAWIYGMCGASFWHSALVGSLWRRISSDFDAFAEPWVVLWGNVLFGIALSLVPRRARGLEALLGGWEVRTSRSRGAGADGARQGSG